MTAIILVLFSVLTNTPGADTEDPEFKIGAANIIAVYGTTPEGRILLINFGYGYSKGKADARIEFLNTYGGTRYAGCLVAQKKAVSLLGVVPLSECQPPLEDPKSHFHGDYYSEARYEVATQVSKIRQLSLGGMSLQAFDDGYMYGYGSSSVFTYEELSGLGIPTHDFGAKNYPSLFAKVFKDSCLAELFSDVPKARYRDASDACISGALEIQNTTTPLTCSLI